MRPAEHARRWARAAVPVVAAAAAAVALSGWGEPAWREVAAVQPRAEAGDWAALATHGAAPALLGGGRALVADVFWLRANLAWERRDADALRANLALAVTADPRSTVFWVQGARILAFDVANWRLVEAGGHEGAPPVVARGIQTQQADEALAWLRRGLAAHPGDGRLWLEAGVIHVQRRGDVAAAAECYRRAAEDPRAPAVAARLHAEMLVRMGRLREAWRWLVELHPRLPADHPAARAEEVLVRIRQLEEKLAVPAADRYQPRSHHE